MMISTHMTTINDLNSTTTTDGTTTTTVIDNLLSTLMTTNGTGATTTINGTIAIAPTFEGFDPIFGGIIVLVCVFILIGIPITYAFFKISFRKPATPDDEETGIEETDNEVKVELISKSSC